MKLATDMRYTQAQGTNTRYTGIRSNGCET